MPFASRSLRRARDDYEVESDFSELTIEGIAAICMHGFLNQPESNITLITEMLQKARAGCTIELNDVSGAIVQTYSDNPTMPSTRTGLADVKCRR